MIAIEILIRMNHDPIFLFNRIVIKNFKQTLIEKF